MKKELKDYLHLYFGCECLLDNERIGILIGMDSRLEDNDIEMVCFTIWDKKDQDWTVYNDDGKFSRIKPILRPLSDMTEEEAIRLLKNISLFDLDEDNNCVFDIIEDEEGFYVNAEVDGKVVDALKMSVNSDIVEVMNNDGTFLPVNPQADVFHYLLSKYFDLFGLIESGLAIDKTTLKTKTTNT